MSAGTMGKTIKCIDTLIMRNANVIGQKNLDDDLSPMQGWIIGFLYFNRDHVIYQKDIEKEFGIPKSTLATILKNMSEKGYIQRENAEHDTRLKRILLSQKAINHQKRCIGNYQKIDEYLCEDLTQEEVETFLRIGAKMKNSLEKHLKEVII